MFRALVIDALPKSDSIQEGKVIASALVHFGIDAELKTCKRNEDVRRALFNADDRDIIHLSGHGSYEWFGTPRGGIETHDFYTYFEKRLDPDERWLDDTAVLVNTACGSASRQWKDLAIDDLRVRNYIAAGGSPTNQEGLLFALTFYSNLWDATRRLPVKAAFRRTVGMLRTEIKWKHFQ